MSNVKRAVGVIRLSVEREESVSPERQREIVEAKARARGSEIVGWAEDLDLSAWKLHPRKRPKLAAWLDRPGDFDELVLYRLDRFVRRAYPDLADMIAWGIEHDVALVSATEELDLSGPIGRRAGDGRGA